jgi:hypothetical protein
MLTAKNRLSGPQVRFPREVERNALAPCQSAYPFYGGSPIAVEGGLIG